MHDATNHFFQMQAAQQLSLGDQTKPDLFGELADGSKVSVYVDDEASIHVHKSQPADAQPLAKSIAGVTLSDGTRVSVRKVGWTWQGRETVTEIQFLQDEQILAAGIDEVVDAIESSELDESNIEYLRQTAVSCIAGVK